MTTHLYPVLRYERAHEAVAWLGRAFEFSTAALFDGPDHTVTHAELTYGTGTVGLSTAGPVDEANIWTTVREGIYVCLEDPDGHHARANAAGAVIERELRDLDYGSREYTARDSDGRLWSFGTYKMARPAGPPTFFPELCSNNARAAVTFLSQAFGLEPGLRVDANGTVAHAELWLGDEALLVGSAEASHQRHGRSLCTHVVVTDPDAHCARAEAAGAVIVSRPHDTTYGARAYVAQDLEGVLWSFSTYRPRKPGR